MTETTYDIPIGEVAKILDKSDRQVRRYVKERRLKAKAVRIDGHIKLMFSREEVETFRDRLSPDRVLADEAGQEITEAELVTDETEAEAGEPSDEVVKTGAGDVQYVVDALREQLTALRDENRDLHYQLEQRSGQVGFLQAKIETMQDELKALAPATKPETGDRKPWYRRWFGRE